MFDGASTAAELMVDRSIIGSIIDRFGKDVEMSGVDEGHALVHVTVLESGVFFGWLAQFGTLVSIRKPQTMAAHYHDYLADIVRSYE